MQCAFRQFESVIGGIVNESGFIGFDEKEELVTVHKAAGEPLIYAGLAGQFSSMFSVVLKGSWAALT